MTDTKPATNSHRLIPFVLVAVGFILINASAYYIYQNHITAPPTFTVVPVEVDYPAPKLTLTDLQGASHALADYRGQVILVNLWATWCEPCKKEMPALQAYHDKYGRDGFSVIAINDGDPTSDVEQFVKDFDLSFPVWLDPTYTATEKAFKTMNLPSSFVIDRRGIVRLQWVGAIDKKALEKNVTPIIREEQ